MAMRPTILLPTKVTEVTAILFFAQALSMCQLDVVQLAALVNLLTLKVLTLQERLTAKGTEAVQVLTGLASLLAPAKRIAHVFSFVTLYSSREISESDVKY